MAQNFTSNYSKTSLVDEGQVFSQEMRSTTRLFDSSSRVPHLPEEQDIWRPSLWKCVPVFGSLYPDLVWDNVLCITNFPQNASEADLLNYLQPGGCSDVNMVSIGFALAYYKDRISARSAWKGKISTMCAYLWLL